MIQLSGLTPSQQFRHALGTASSCRSYFFVTAVFALERKLDLPLAARFAAPPKISQASFFGS
jgi:hypothetical protein